MWQQDSATAHNAKRTREGLKSNAFAFVPFSSWPPTSDLNPLDYFVWSYMENMTNCTSHNTKQSLITCIKEKFIEIEAAQI
uniref:Tc1-like transposase DDE domain-containing protein n=1 Tax=Lepeophtheirus salmonis TaxID=72036 RepID=A0A0K2U8U3_LEPSM